MKRNFLLTFVLTLILSFSCFVNYCDAQWQSLSGLPGGSVRCLGLVGTKIFVGMDVYGVMFSTNNGSNWYGNSFNNRSINCFATLGSDIFCGTMSYGIYKSTDAGGTWNQTAMTDKNIYSLAVNGSTIYAGTENYGVWRSTNNGTTWTQTGFTDKFILSLAAYGNYLIAGTFAQGIYASTNNGISWTLSNITDKTARSMVVSGSTVFVGVDAGTCGVYKTINGGATWTTTSFNNKAGYSLALSGNKVYVGSQGYGPFLSANNGDSWADVSTGYNAATTLALLTANNYLILGDMPQGLYRRTLTEISVQNISTEIPSQYNLEQNYPNPFNPGTKIRFDIPKLSSPNASIGNPVLLKIYDVIGREIQTLVNEKLQPGTYETTFDGSQLTSGVYFYKLITNDFTETKRMLMIK